MIVIENGNPCSATASDRFYRLLVWVFLSLSEVIFKFELTLAGISEYSREEISRRHNVYGTIIVIVRPNCARQRALRPKTGFTGLVCEASVSIVTPQLISVAFRVTFGSFR